MLINNISEDKTVEEYVEVEWVEVGDVVQVVPGEKIPTDGTVVYGTSHLDESMLTGESISVPKKVGGGRGERERGKKERGSGEGVQKNWRRDTTHHPY